MARRIFVFLIGIILAVFLLEAGLSLAGSIVHKWVNIRNKFAGKIHSKRYVVLCLGNFNLRGEPVVGAPEDAIACYMNSSMDYLVLGNYILDKQDYLQAT